MTEMNNTIVFAAILLVSTSISAKYIMISGIFAILDKVNNYMRCNLLHINFKKCCFMYFSLNKREMRNEGADEDDTILAIEGTIIKRVTETKFLGVNLAGNYI